MILLDVRHHSAFDTDNMAHTQELREGLISLQIAALPPVEVERLIAEMTKIKMVQSRLENYKIF